MTVLKVPKIGPCIDMDNVHSGSKRLYFECDSEQVKEQDF